MKPSHRGVGKIPIYDFVLGYTTYLKETKRKRKEPRKKSTNILITLYFINALITYQDMKIKFHKIYDKKKFVKRMCHNNICRLSGYPCSLRNLIFKSKDLISI